MPKSCLISNELQEKNFVIHTLKGRKYIKDMVTIYGEQHGFVAETVLKSLCLAVDIRHMLIRCSMTSSMKFLTTHKEAAHFIKWLCKCNPELSQEDIIEKLYLCQPLKTGA